MRGQKALKKRKSKRVVSGEQYQGKGGGDAKK